MIQELLDDLRRDEGWSPVPYRDSEGYLTTGFGFLIDERKPINMPIEVGELWLQTICFERLAELKKVLPWLNYQPEKVQRVLTNMAYNLGVSGTLQFQHMLTALQQGDMDMAVRELLDSKAARQLPQRYARLASLLRET